MTLVSVAAMFPNRITVTGAIIGIIAFNFAARYEERKFEGSPVAAEYAAYKQRTGRFVPRLGAELRAR
jgi:protein-S-isoprenylcysteine O-methyltransferase Ste14